MTLPDEIRVPRWIPGVDSHDLVPPVRHWREARINPVSQLTDRLGQRVRIVLVLALSEAMPRHHHTASIAFFPRIKRTQRGTFTRRQQACDRRASVAVQFFLHARPGNRIDARLDTRSETFSHRTHSISVSATMSLRQV